MQDPHEEGQSPLLHWGRALKVSALGCSEVRFSALYPTSCIGNQFVKALQCYTKVIVQSQKEFWSQNVGVG